MTKRIPVCDAGDLQPGERTIIEHRGREIGVLNVEGSLYAIENTCPHLGGPVCTGKVGKEVEAELVGTGRRPKEQFGDMPTVACPWHGWEFRLETGEHVGDPSVGVRTYDVEMIDETVYLKL